MTLNELFNIPKVKKRLESLDNEVYQQSKKAIEFMYKNCSILQYDQNFTATLIINLINDIKRNN